MLDFLSDEWFAALGDCLREAAVASPVDDTDPGGIIGVTIGQIVTGVPWLGGGDLSYTVRVGPTDPGVTPGTVDGAHVILVAAYKDASAVASGDTTAGQLLDTGRIKIRGDGALLMRATAAVEIAGRAVAELRERTVVR